MSNRYLVVFATDDLARRLDAFVDSARSSGQFAEVIVWDEARLRSDDAFAGRDLLEHRRGVGYFSWKPHIIQRALADAHDGDVVVYSDVGRYRAGYTLRRDIDALVAFGERNGGFVPGVLIPNFGANSRWTKRDCFVLMDCDAPYFWHHPQVQATFSLWTKNETCVRFVGEWSTYCSDIRIVGDGPNTCGLPNLDGFVSHRHDQSVLTNLVLKWGASPFSIDDRLFRWLVSMRPSSLSASLVTKDIDHVLAIASGASPLRLLAREALRSATAARLLPTTTKEKRGRIARR